MARRKSSSGSGSRARRAAERRRVCKECGCTPYSDGWVAVGDVAQAFRVDRSTVHRWARQGKLTWRRWANCREISHRSVHEWMAKMSAIHRARL